MSVTQTVKGNYILAVDDIPDNLLLVQLALEQEGHHVVLAHDGETALKQIKQAPPQSYFIGRDDAWDRWL